MVCSRLGRVAGISLIGFGVFLSWNSHAAGTIGGPDGFGYGFIDNEETGGPTYEWEDISTTGTIQTGSGGSHTTTLVSMGMTFPFYGTNYTQVYISTNGYVSFTSSNDGYSYQSMPNASTPNAVIAVYWAHIHMNSGGTVRYQTVASPTTHFVVQWTNADNYDIGGTQTLTFQVKLYPTGQIIMNYQTMTGTSGATASCGIENAAGNVGLAYQVNGSPSANSLYGNLCISWGLGVDPDPPTALLQAADPAGPSQPVDFISDSTVYFRGKVSDPDASQTVGLQAEILPITDAFDPVLVTGQLAVSGLVANGGTPEATYTFTGAPFGNGTYHWRARSVDQFGRTSAWVTPPEDRFQVDIVAPVAPALTSPYPGQDVPVGDKGGGLVTFVVTPPADAGPAPLALWDFEAAKDPTFGSPDGSAYGIGAPVATFYLTTSNQNYYWRARSTDSVGNIGAWSAGQAFRVVFDDSINHSSGDSKRTCGFAATGASGLAAGMLGLLALAGFGRKVRK